MERGGVNSSTICMVDESKHVLDFVLKTFNVIRKSGSENGY